jgi:histidinol-phosphatase
MISERELTELLAFSGRTLDKSRKLLLEYSSRSFSSELKSDNSVVTEADKAAEELIRAEIAREMAGHSILGEEFGGGFDGAEYQWVIDPIDGTANFLTGIPTYGTILALFYKGEPVVGMTDHPLLDRRYYATKQGGVHFQGKRLKVRGLSDASQLNPLENLAVSSRLTFARSDHENLFDKIFKTHPSIRIYRDVFAHALVASGSIGGMVEWESPIWDLAVAKLFTEEAGGEYFEFSAKNSKEDKSVRTAIFGERNVVSHLKNLFAEAIG